MPAADSHQAKICTGWPSLHRLGIPSGAACPALCHIWQRCLCATECIYVAQSLAPCNSQSQLGWPHHRLPLAQQRHRWQRDSVVWAAQGRSGARFYPFHRSTACFLMLSKSGSLQCMKRQFLFLCSYGISLDCFCSDIFGSCFYFIFLSLWVSLYSCYCS